MFTRFYALLRAFISVKQFNVFTRFYALLSQLSSLASLRAFISVKQFNVFISVKQFTPFTPFTVYSVYRTVYVRKSGN